MLRLRTAIGLVGALCVAAAILSACSQTSPRPSGALPSIRPSATPSSAAQVSLPLDAYAWTTEQDAVITRARQLLVADCMRARGFTYHQTIRQPSAADLREFRSWAFGLLDPRRAAEYGYHDPLAVSGRKQFATTNPPWMTADYLRALNGAQSVGAHSSAGTGDGCAAQTQAVLLPAGLPLDVAELDSRAGQKARSDPRVVAVVGEWSTCMGARGFAYATPLSAKERTWGSPTSKPDEQELATARADIACKDRTNLVSIWLAAEAAYQRLEIDGRSAALDQLKHESQEVVARAQKIVAEHGSATSAGAR